MKDVCIRLKNVDKYYGEIHIVKNMSLDVYDGEFLTFLGPSGCGKTTTLRMIAGFEEPTDGEIYIKGKEVSHLPPYKRDVNTVFQNYALFPHLTVRENIEYGLKRKGVVKSEMVARVNDVLRMVQMEQFASRKPKQMSGGQQQRVAVARAIVNNPTVLLLDEPLGALDMKLRKQMQLELKHLQQKLGMTFIYVTHDQEEALTMSDRVAVMNNGCIEQIAPPQQIYNFPTTTFVADFIGETNLLEGTVMRQVEDTVELTIFDGHVSARAQKKWDRGDQVIFSIRPEHLYLTKDENATGFHAKVIEYVFVGTTFKVILEKEGQAITLYSANRFQRIGEIVYVAFKEMPIVVGEVERTFV